MGGNRLRSFLAATSLALARSEHPAPDEVSVPVEVDQQGTTIQFTVAGDTDGYYEALEFCAAHLKTLDTDKCAHSLLNKVSILRKQRIEAIQELPGITFTVNDAKGNTLRFIHNEGANPANEAKAFCLDHFANVPERECVDAMMQNAKRALDEIQSRHPNNVKAEL